MSSVIAQTLFVGWHVLAILCVVACVYAADRLLRAVELPAQLWRVLRLLTRVVVAAIAIGATALLAYLVSLATIDSRLLSAHDSMLSMPLLPTLAVIVAGGLVAAVVAVVALRQDRTLS